MRKLMRTAMLLVAVALSAPASAQVVENRDSGTATETQERLAEGRSSAQDNWWNIIGLIGLLGLIGLKRESDNDGYTDDPI